MAGHSSSLSVFILQWIFVYRGFQDLFSDSFFKISASLSFMCRVLGMVLESSVSSFFVGPLRSSGNISSPNTLFLLLLLSSFFFLHLLLGRGV